MRQIPYHSAQSFSAVLLGQHVSLPQILKSKKLHKLICTIPFLLFGGKHTALRRISCLLGEALASTTSLLESLEMTGFSTMVASSSNCPYGEEQS